MFKIGERRKSAKVTPGVISLSVLRADSIDPEHKEELPYSYCVVKCDAHDDQFTELVQKDINDDGQHTVVWAESSDTKFQFEIDVPSTDYENQVEVEMWSAAEFREGDDWIYEDKDYRDVMVGSFRFPIEWVINSFGGGYGISSDEPGNFRFVLQDKAGQSFPYEVEIRVGYKVEPSGSQRATMRWTSKAFDGVYKLDKDRSDTWEPFLKATRVPFVLRKLLETVDETTLEVRVYKGGSEISFDTSTSYFKEKSGMLRIDELFQSTKTFSGQMVEKRLYWDFSSMGQIVKGQPYPSGILVTVTRVNADSPQVVEAWDLSKDRQTLSRLAMIKELKLRQVYVRDHDIPRSIVRHPKVATRPGTVVVAVLRGVDLSPEDNPMVNAFAALKVITFSNKDMRYTQPFDDDDPKEEMTQVQEQDGCPEWGQVFSFKVNPEANYHSILQCMVWNQEGEDEEVLIGSCRIPVPWIFNGFGSDLGPSGVSSFESSFKLKRGDSLDPTQKIKYGGGRIRLKLSFQPDV